MLQKHQVNWAAWRPTLVLTQQTNYIITVHIGNHTPQTISLLLIFSSMQTLNHEPKPWIHLLETFCTGHSLHPPLPLLSWQTLEPGTGCESWLVAHHLLSAAFILQESHSLLTYMSHMCIHHIQATHTEDKPHSSQLLLRKTKWPAPAQSLKKITYNFRKC